MSRIQPLFCHLRPCAVPRPIACARRFYASTTQDTPQPEKLPTTYPPTRYHVSRSDNKNLPVYTDFKRGGNLHLTTVRKITGDIAALRDELKVYLNKPNDVTINEVTKHVVVKGKHVPEIKKFLEERGM